MTETIDRHSADRDVLVVDPGVRKRWSPASLISTAAVACACILLLAPVISTPYIDDDLANSTVPKILSVNHFTRWHYISMWNGIWMRGEGRFFPGALTYGTFLFTTLTTRLSYKIYVFILMLVLVFALCVLVRRLTGSAPSGLLMIGVVVSCWEFHYPKFFDAIDAFQGLLPWTVLLMVMALLLITQACKGWRSTACIVGGGVAWAVALVTYEVSLLLLPCMIAALYLVRMDQSRRRIATFALAIPALVDIAIVAWLRAHLIAPPGAEWTLRFEPVAVVTTVKQLIGALPLAQYWVSSASRPALQLGWLIFPVYGVAVAVLLSLWSAWRRLAAPAPRQLWLIGLIGVWTWLAPSILVGLTERWQTDIVWGEAYIPAFFETIGIGFFAVAGLSGLRRCALNEGNQLLRISASLMAFVILAAAGISLAMSAELNIHWVWTQP